MIRKPRSKCFATEKERDRFIKDFQKEMGAHGVEVFKIDAKLQREWIEVAEILLGVSPIAFAQHWLSTRSGGTERRTFTEAMQAYLLEMKRAGLDPDYQKHTLRALNRFVSQHGGRAVEEITTAEILEFIHGLPFQPLTKRHYRTYLVGAFKWFVKQGWA